jgi:hypothetical protein
MLTHSYMQGSQNQSLYVPLLLLLQVRKYPWEWHE